MKRQLFKPALVSLTVLLVSTGFLKGGPDWVLPFNNWRSGCIPTETQKGKQIIKFTTVDKLIEKYCDLFSQDYKQYPEDLDNNNSNFRVNLYYHLYRYKGGAYYNPFDNAWVTANYYNWSPLTYTPDSCNLYAFELLTKLPKDAQTITRLFENYGPLLFDHLDKEQYISAGINEAIDDLLLAHKAHMKDFESYMQCCDTLLIKERSAYDDYYFRERFLAKQPFTHSLEASRVTNQYWFNTFWYRREKEGNRATVREILWKIKRHYEK